MSKSKFFIFSFLILFTFSAFAQEDKKPKSVFTFGGEVRPRTEYKHGYKSLVGTEFDAPVTTSQRSRLNLNYKSDKLVTKIVLQDVRMWGSQKQLVPNEDFAVSVHEAWGEMFLTKNFSLKSGRMEIVYDDHRIFGSVGWAQQARSHDALMFKYTAKKMHFHLGGAMYNSNNNFYDGPNAYKAFQFAHFNYKAKPFNFSLLFLNNGKSEDEYSLTYDDFVNGTGTRVGQSKAYSQTIGGRFEYKDNGLTFIAGGYYQMGVNPGSWATAADSIPLDLEGNKMTIESAGYKTGAGLGQEIGAYQFNVEVGYKVSGVYLAGGVEMLSGNSFAMDANKGTDTDPNSAYGTVSATDDIQSAFTPFYGTNHKFNGWMDYFYVGNHGGNVGLTDIYGKIVYKQDKFFVKLIPHYFMTSGTGSYSTADVDADGVATGTFTEKTYSGALGTEIDLWCGYNVTKGASIQFGYSHLLATDAMKALKTGSLDTEINGSQNWAWVMFVYKPNFLTHKVFE